MYCANCGNQMDDRAAICVKCGVPTGVQGVQVATTVEGKSRLAYILLGVFVGMFGVHNFYAGHTGKAVAQLLITLLIGWLIVPLIAVWIWVIVEVCTVKIDGKGRPMVVS